MNSRRGLYSSVVTNSWRPNRLCIRWCIARIGQRGWLLAIAALGLAAGSHAIAQAAECTKVVVTADPEFPPYAWYDGKQLRGASVDVVTSVLDSMHLPYELRYVGPFVRVLRSARFGEVDIVTELKRNPEREQFLVFSESPIFSNPSSVFVRSDVSRTVNSREALVGLRGGVTHGTKFGDGMDEYIDAHLSVEVAPGIKENFAKLAAGRIDYFLSPHYPALSYLIASGRADQFQALKPFVAQAMNYVGWSRKSACLARLDEFNAGLRRYLASINSMRLVEASYDLWQHSPQMVR